MEVTKNGKPLYNCIGQCDNANDAMFAVLHKLVGSPAALETTRGKLGSIHFVVSDEWMDTLLVSDMITAYEAAKAERKSRPECV